MSSVYTTFLPLTTTFTAPAECTNGPWIYLGVPTTWWKAGGDNVASCFPPAYPFSRSRIVYSPGVCPGGWTSACERQITRSGNTESVVSCCPAYYECAASKVEHDWEDGFGCKSQFFVDVTGWSLSSDAKYVSSIYQLPVMVVEATTTTISLALTELPHSPASPTIDPTASPTITSNDNGVSLESPRTENGLSKGAIAGTAVGAITGVAILGLLAFTAWTMHKRGRQQNTTVGPNPSTITSYYYQGFGDIPPDYHHASGPERVEIGGGQPRPIHELKGS